MDGDYQPEKALYFSPIGTYEITADTDGILSIKLISEKKEEKTSRFESDSKNCHLRDCLTWMDIYFTDLKLLAKTKRPVLNKKKWKHKSFCCNVWKTLEDKLPPGKVLSYGQVAKMVGNEKASRAVGMAMKTNPFSIIMPCHRVVSKDRIGNYSSINGVKTKMWLLEHENVDLKNYR